MEPPAPFWLLYDSLSGIFVYDRQYLFQKREVVVKQRKEGMEECQEKI